jgi:outer membrane cobalamin receptor
VDEHRFGPLSLDAGLRWAKTYINEYGAFNINGSPKGFNQVSPILDEWEPSIFNGSLGAAYLLSKRLSFHFNLAAGYIQPRRGTLDINLQEPKNEGRLKLDLGVRAMREKVGQFSVVGFLTQQRDALVLSGQTETANGRVMELYMNRHQNQLGVEFELLSEPILEIAQIFFNITAMRSRAESNGQMKRNRELPQFILGGGIYASKSKLDLNLFCKFVSSYESTRFLASGQGESPTPQPLGDFLTLNANIGWSFGKGTKLSLQAENLTDKKFSTVVGYADYGRRFTVNLRQTFMSNL